MMELPTSEEFREVFGNDILDQMEPFLNPNLFSNWDRSEEEIKSKRIELTLYHRPRGSKGVWKIISEGDKVRVTTGKGKRLKLSINSSEQIPNLKLDVLQKAIKLYDLSDNETNSVTQNGFTIQSVEHSNKIIDYHINVEKGGPKLQFGFFLKLVSSEPNQFQTLEGRSVEFATHNSGGTVSSSFVNTKRKRIKTLTLKESNSTVSHARLELPLEIKTETKWDESSQSSTSDDLSETHSISPQEIPIALPDPLLPRATEIQLPINKLDENGFDTNNIPDSMFIRYFVPGNLDVQGNVKAKGFSQLSDARLKTNITSIGNALQIVSKLRGKRYQWKTDISSLSGIDRPEAEKVIGLIAQEVEKVLPEVVHQDLETGLKSVSYSEILPVLIEAFNDFVSMCRDEEEITALKLRMIQGNLEQLEREVREQMDDHRALQMAIVSHTFIDKLYPKKPLKLTESNKQQSLIKKFIAKARRAAGLLLQTAFTVGVVFVLLLFAEHHEKSKDKDKNLHSFSVSDKLTYLFHGECLDLYGNVDNGWYSYNRCPYPINPVLKCLDTETSASPIGFILPHQEIKIPQFFQNCSFFSVFSEDSMKGGTTKHIKAFDIGPVQQYKQETVLLFGNSSLGWGAYNLGDITVFPTFRCFGSVFCNFSKLSNSNESVELKIATEIDINYSVGCEMCVALLENIGYYIDTD